MKFRKIALMVTAASLSWPAFAQDSVPTDDTEAAKEEDGTAIIVTGSRIKQDPSRSALPLQIIKKDDLSREGISNTEQLI